MPVAVGGEATRLGEGEATEEIFGKPAGIAVMSNLCVTRLQPTNQVSGNWASGVLGFNRQRKSRRIGFNPAGKRD
jgi:hypothetical protein